MSYTIHHQGIFSIYLKLPPSMMIKSRKATQQVIQDSLSSAIQSQFSLIKNSQTTALQPLILAKTISNVIAEHIDVSG